MKEKKGKKGGKIKGRNILWRLKKKEKDELRSTRQKRNARIAFANEADRESKGEKSEKLLFNVDTATIGGVDKGGVRQTHIIVPEAWRSSGPGEGGESGGDTKVAGVAHSR